MTSHHNSEIARSGSPSCRCLSTGRPAFPYSLGRAATFNHSQHQRLAHTERGKLVGMCAPTLGVAKTGRFCGLGCFTSGSRTSACGYYLLTYLAGRFGVRSSFRAFDGIEAGTSHLVANLIQSRREGVLKRISQRLPRHLRKSFRVSVASTTTKPREAMNAVPKFREAGSSHDR